MRQSSGQAAVKLPDKAMAHRTPRHGPSVKRLAYTPPEDPVAARCMETIIAYLKEKRVVDNMEKYTEALAKKDSLPYNPYPGLAKQFMLHAEKYHMMEEEDASIKSKLQRPVQATTSDLIWGLQGCTSVWGLKNLVQVVNPEYVMDTQRVLDTNDQSGRLVIENSSYTGQVLVSVIGPLALMGSFHPRPLRMDTRQEYLIYGEDVNEGLHIFASSVVADIEEDMKSDTARQLLYVSCTTSMDGQKSEMRWTGRGIQDEKEKFKDKIIETMKEKGIIKAEIIFRDAKQSTSGPKLIRGSKEYILHFIEVSPQRPQESLISFGEFPYQTLVEGIFLKKADAEAYISAMRRHPVNPGIGLPKKLSRRMTSKSGGQMMAAATSKPAREGLEEVIKKPLSASLLSTAGARTSTRNQAGLSRSHFLKMTQGSSEVPDCYRILHTALVLILLDRTKYKLDTLVTIYRFLQSTSARFYIAAQLNQSIIDFIQGVGMDSESHSVLLALLGEYKRDLLTVLDPSVHERPHHQMAYHSYFQYFMIELEGLLNRDGGTHIDAKQVIRKCLEFDMFCNAVQCQLTEDALANMEHFSLKKFVSECENQLAKVDTQNRKTEASSVKSDTSIKSSPSDQRLFIKHGIEPPQILHQRLKYLSVEGAVETSNHPVIMAKDGVIMQYLIDARVDEVWGSFLGELINSDRFPSNPYPRLVTALRSAAFGMRLCGEKDSHLIQTLTGSVKPKLVDATLGLFMLPDLGVYGHRSALMIADQDKLKKALQLTDAISDNEFISQRGKFQISSGISLTGRTVFYGRMAPYVLKLEAHHHFYIKGPLGSNAEALQLFSKLVSDDVTSLRESDHNFILLGLYMDGREVVSFGRLSDQLNVSAIVLDAASRKVDIHIKLYQAVGWRYIPIIKHYRLHFLFVDNADDRHEAYYPGDPADELWYMFLSIEEATEFLQNCAVPQSTGSTTVKSESLDNQRSRCIRNQRMLPAYESYLMECLLHENTAPLADIWRMFHSPATQVEYVMKLCGSLSDLVALSLTVRESEEKIAPSPSLQETRGRSKKGNPQPIKPVETQVKDKGKVNQRTLYKMALAFREKLRDTLAEPTLFAPTCLIDVIEAKMQKLLNVETSTVVLDNMSIISLEEIYHLLKPLLLAGASEVDSTLKTMTRQDT